MQHSSDPALARVRVLDLTRSTAGAMCSLLLADQGADVLALDADSCVSLSPVARAALQRGKRCCVLAGTDAERAALVLELARGADVVIHDATEAALDAQISGLRASTERVLVQLVLRSFPAADTRANAPLDDAIVCAATGLFSDVSLTRSAFRLPPVYTALPLPSAYASVHGAIGVLAALRVGRSDRIEVSLAESALAAMGMVVLQVDPQPSRYDVPPMLGPVTRIALAALQKLGPSGKLDALLVGIGRAQVPPLFDAYRCADGRFLYVVAMDHARHAVRLLDQLGLRERMRNAGLDVRPMYEAARRDNLADAALLGAGLRRTLRRVLAERFATRDAASWEVQLAAADVPCAVVRSGAEWLGEPSVRDAQLAVELHDPEHGAVVQAGIAVCVTGERATPPARARRLQSEPPAWQPRDAALTPASVPDGALPLRGVRVLDLSTVIAGPACARTLAQLGAEVIKIEAPEPLHGPRLTCQYGLEVNTGKRSMIIDLKQPQGRAAFESLARDAQVLVHNFSPDALAQFGWSVDGAPGLPHLVFCALGAFQGPARGAWDRRRGYDPVLQAATGIMHRFGEPAAPELHAVASCVDYLAGYLAAFGALLALHARRLGATTSHARASLAQAAQWVQQPLLYAHGVQRWDEPSGQRARGERADHRLYRARDGWLFLAVEPGRGTGSRAHEALPAAPGAELEQYVARHTSDALRAQLSASGVHIERVADVQALRRPDHPFVRAGLIRTERHPMGSDVTFVAARYLHSTRWALRQGEPAERPGSSTGAVLRSHGYTDAQLADLYDRHAVASSWSAEQLPK